MQGMECNMLYMQWQWWLKLRLLGQQAIGSDGIGIYVSEKEV